MRDHALFLNGVFGHLLPQILPIQDRLPDHIMYLQPYLPSRIVRLSEYPPKDVTEQETRTRHLMRAMQNAGWQAWTQGGDN